MDQGRLLIAIVLSILVFIVWGFFFQDKTPPVTQNPSQVSSEVASSPEKSKSGAEQASATASGVQEQQLPAYQKSKDVVINTPLYSVTISDSGACFKSFVLKKYKETVDPNSPDKEFIPQGMRLLNLGFSGNSIPEINTATFLSNATAGNVDIQNKPQEISFLWTSPSGISVEKRFVFNPNSYLIDLNVIIRNTSSTPFQDHVELSLMNKIVEGKATYGFEGSSALIDNSLEQITPKDAEKKNVYTGKIAWSSIEERYFMSAIVPSKPENASIHLSYVKEDLTSKYIEPELRLNSGAQQTYHYNVYVGPKSYTVLSSLGVGLDRAIHFGFFDILAKPMLRLLNFLYGFFPNYGVDIIVLTLIIKAVLWPLGSKSYKSMSAMKRIQPLMAQIREKYKDDKQKMNEETMALYRTYKVNPLGGCLPMVLQIPVFFALYRMLYEAIELRHAPFLGWINDLSAPDRLFHFPFSIPFMHPPYGIPVLTIVMGATMLLQQKMSPPMGDPAQAKMMMFMPLIFTFIFINFSSGLVLYWLVNNIVSISQQYYIQKKFDKQ